jgi:PAS domain S-box-containing protein
MTNFIAGHAGAASTLVGHSLADRTGKLLAVDAKVCEIMQREEQELVGIGFEALTHPADCRRNVTAVAGLMIGDGPLTIRKRYIRPDGSAVWSNVQISRLQGSDGGRLIGTIQMTSPDSVQRNPESLWRAARLVDARIQCRRRELGEDLFSDHGWIILNQIYLAEAEGRTADAAAISDLAAVRRPVVDHWLAVLERNRLVERTACQPRVPQLTARGMRKVESILDSSVDHCTATR